MAAEYAVAGDHGKASCRSLDTDKGLLVNASVQECNVSREESAGATRLSALLLPTAYVSGGLIFPGHGSVACHCTIQNEVEVTTGFSAGRTVGTLSHKSIERTHMQNLTGVSSYVDTNVSQTAEGDALTSVMGRYSFSVASLGAAVQLSVTIIAVEFAVTASSA